MNCELYKDCISRYADVIEKIKLSAHNLHESVNQTYDDVLPYGYHLDMVVDAVYKYGHEVCASESDILPLFFGAYYHDSIEDARLTYNDVMEIASQYMNEEQALMATEIVYALTNDKGRTRAERAGEKYYKGIRETPYAPFTKLADRLANITYSTLHSNKNNARMKTIYREELPHFLEAIAPQNNPDVRFSLPQTIIDELHRLTNGK